MDDVETPPTLTDEDEALLSAAWRETFMKTQGGIVQGLCFLSDAELRAEWAEVQAGRKDWAPESWRKGLERRIAELDAREGASDRGTIGAPGPGSGDEGSRG